MNVEENLSFELPQINDSQTFDIQNELTSQRSSSSKSSLNFKDFSDDYLRMNVGLPLSLALTFVLLYRPDDAIEFLAKRETQNRSSSTASSSSHFHSFSLVNDDDLIVEFLIDWSRETIRQGTIDDERRKALNSFTKQHKQTGLHDKEDEENALEHQHNQKRRLIFEYDQRLFTSYQWNFHLDPRTDDEREPTMNFIDQGHEQMNLKVIDRFHIPVYIHSHETSTGIDNEHHEQLPSPSSICGYFRHLNQRIRRCDENDDDYSNI